MFFIVQGLQAADNATLEQDLAAISRHRYSCWKRLLFWCCVSQRKSKVIPVPKDHFKAEESLSLEIENIFLKAQEELGVSSTVPIFMTKDVPPEVECDEDKYNLPINTRGLSFVDTIISCCSVTTYIGTRSSGKLCEMPHGVQRYCAYREASHLVHDQSCECSPCLIFCCTCMGGGLEVQGCSQKTFRRFKNYRAERNALERLRCFQCTQEVARALGVNKGYLKQEEIGQFIGLYRKHQAVCEHHRDAGLREHS